MKFTVTLPKSARVPGRGQMKRKAAGGPQTPTRPTLTLVLRRSTHSVNPDARFTHSKSVKAGGGTRRTKVLHWMPEPS
jgi:hypothetical protein